MFLSLPDNNGHCSKVDTKTGLWYFCATCTKKVPCRTGRPFTLARWNDHEVSPSHREKVRRIKETQRLALKQKAKSSNLTSIEKGTLKQLSKHQCQMQNFFSMTMSKKVSTKVKNLGVMTVPTPASSKTVESDLEDVVEVVDKMQPLKRGKCEGVLPDYCGLLEDLLQPYCVYAAIDKESLYKVGYVAGPRGKKAQVFSKKCMGGKGVYRKHQHGRIFSCNSCENLR